MTPAVQRIYFGLRGRHPHRVELDEIYPTQMKDKQIPPLCSSGKKRTPAVHSKQEIIAGVFITLHLVCIQGRWNGAEKNNFLEKITTKIE